MFFELIKRALPFGLAMAIGILAALPFLSASSVQTNPDEALRDEIRRLKKENHCMKRKMEMMHYRSHLEGELPVPPPPPPAPVAPLSPEPPAPPVAPEPPRAR